MRPPSLCLLFKSGATQKFPVTDFKVRYRDEKLTSLTWTDAPGAGARLLHADLSEIAAVWTER